VCRCDRKLLNVPSPIRGIFSFQVSMMKGAAGMPWHAFWLNHFNGPGPVNAMCIGIIPTDQLVPSRSETLPGAGRFTLEEQT